MHCIALAQVGMECSQPHPSQANNPFHPPNPTIPKLLNSATPIAAVGNCSANTLRTIKAAYHRKFLLLHQEKKYLHHLRFLVETLAVEGETHSVAANPMVLGILLLLMIMMMMMNMVHQY